MGAWVERLGPFRPAGRPARAHRGMPGRGSRAAGREGVSGSEFVGGPRKAEPGRNTALRPRSRSRQSPTQGAARRSLPLTLPRTQADLRWPLVSRQAQAIIKDRGR
jgi:hypothetical protein